MPCQTCARCLPCPGSDPVTVAMKSAHIPGVTCSRKGSHYALRYSRPVLGHARCSFVAFLLALAAKMVATQAAEIRTMEQMLEQP